MSNKIKEKLMHGLGYRLIQMGFYFAKVRGNYSITKPIDPSNIEVLGDPAFQASVNEVSDLTLLDTGRLANRWQLCRLTDPGGNILEIGSYRGGGALHLSNCCPQRKIIICDSFRGFEALHEDLDKSFDKGMFVNTSKESIEQLFKSRNRNYEVINGFFPASCAGKNISPISFVHLDVDVYKATLESLLYLEQERVLLNRSLIVLDDFCRKAEGVNQAVDEFTAKHKDWISLPLFPGQGVLVRGNWID